MWGQLQPLCWRLSLTKKVLMEKTTFGSRMQSQDSVFPFSALNVHSKMVYDPLFVICWAEAIGTQKKSWCFWTLPQRRLYFVSQSCLPRPVPKSLGMSPEVALCTSQFGSRIRTEPSMCPGQAIQPGGHQTCPTRKFCSYGD